MAYDDYIWIYDVEREAMPIRYHAFKHPNKTAVCGATTTESFGSKLPGAPDCECCLQTTGPDTTPEPEGDLVAFHKLD